MSVLHVFGIERVTSRELCGDGDERIPVRDYMLGVKLLCRNQSCLLSASEHPVAQVRFRQFHCQVKMIAHHHVGVNVPGKMFSRFIERALNGIRRSFRLKDSLTSLGCPIVELRRGNVFFPF